MKRLSYDELRREIEAAPLTWVPALLTVIVQKAVREPVFLEGGMQRTIDSAIAEAKQ